MRLESGHMNPVLIVDDDVATQQLLAALMRRNGFPSVVTSNGAEAIKVLSSQAVAVVILDLMMPEVGGHAVIDYVSREKKDIPVIVCTAAGRRSTESIDSKVVKAIVSKPFDIEELTGLVSSMAGARQT